MFDKNKYAYNTFGDTIMHIKSEANYETIKEEMRALLDR